MANVEHDAFDDESSEAGAPSPMSAALNWIGAVTSVALVVGLSAWVYHLAVRDVSDVPVIRALTGPMRVQPDDPGGTQAAHQGLEVNRVQGRGGVLESTEEIVLAPPPFDLREPGTDEASSSASVLAPKPGREENIDEEAEAAIRAVADKIAGDGVAARGASKVGAVPEYAPGVSHSSRPKPRARPTTAEVVELTAADLAPGTRLVQVGDHESVDTARSEWKRLRTTFGDYMIGKSPIVMKAESAGRTFYRLRITGFENLDDSHRFCAVLLARKATCVPVVHR